MRVFKSITATLVYTVICEFLGKVLATPLFLITITINHEKTIIILNYSIKLTHNCTQLNLMSLPLHYNKLELINNQLERRKILRSRSTMYLHHYNYKQDIIQVQQKVRINGLMSLSFTSLMESPATQITL